MTTEAFDAFLKTAWAEHGDRPQQVADQLAASLPLVQSSAQVRPFAALASHVYGEHLGQWEAGIALLDSMRALPSQDGSAAAHEPIARAIATLRYAGGDPSVLGSLDAHDRTFVLASAAAMFTGRGEFDRAIAAYSQAVKAGEAGLAPKSPAVGALAVGGNNLAAALEGKADATARELEAMVAAAEGGLTFWKQAGTWLQEERAEYRLTRSLLRAGRARDAVASAQRCIAVCAANDAPAFERFFGQAVLALALRAAGDGRAFATHRDLALGLLAQLPEGEKAWCERERAELG
ncbi:hypothetical protein ACPWT1_19820 [Ramlibacter sp. MMS24-I3-19]|uniref:hypothetical protein n=1 Tax=Ramlibacter sp. MMS24-I3-19 TaxID=3416606 RepID=UPI003D0851B1